MDRFQRTVISMEDARVLILQHAQSLEIESIPLDNALHRYLAAALVAPHPLPHFVKSGMDGFAIRAQDIEHAGNDFPITLKVIEHIPAGVVPKKVIGHDQASRIMTGAMLPEGADTVIMFEMTESIMVDNQQAIRIIRSLPVGRNVSQIGSEVVAGEMLLEVGTLIQAGEIALLATFGISEVMVYRQPVVAIMPTGSELLAVTSCLEPGKIRDSNGHTLAALLRQAGAVVHLLDPVEDSLVALKHHIAHAFEFADIVITTGGVSVGDHDVLVDWFEEWEGVTLFNKVMMRPGSPTTVGTHQGKFIFALSGNPSASYVGAILFVLPLLKRMQGVLSCLPNVFQATMVEDFDKSNNFTRFVRGIVELKDGKLNARLAGVDQSSMVRTLATANSLLIIPPGEGVRAGEIIDVLLLKEGISNG
jgi:molybdopterin molybdotransferase